MNFSENFEKNAKNMINSKKFGLFHTQSAKINSAKLFFSDKSAKISSRKIKFFRAILENREIRENKFPRN